MSGPSKMGPPVSPLADTQLGQPPRRKHNFPVVGRFGDYDILGRLALGGMAEILLARDDAGNEVVVKRLLEHLRRDDEVQAMFQAEVAIGQRLNHGNIVRIHRSGVVQGIAFAEMEFIDGVSLRRLIDRQGSVPPALAALIAERVADALDVAHLLCDDEGRSLAVIHRDVNPENIMISFDGQVKLLDFGIAKNAIYTKATRAGVVKGKFAYMAPEQYRREAFDRRVDVFALGTVLYEMLSGSPAFLRGSEAETMRAIVDEEPASLPSMIPGALRGLVRRAMAKSPRQRYATAEEMFRDLKDFRRSTLEPDRPSDLALLLREAFPEEFEHGPEVQSTPFGSSYRDDSEPSPLEVAPTVLAEPRPASGTRELDFAPEPLLELELRSAQLPPDPTGNKPPAANPRLSRSAPATSSPSRRINTSRHPASSASPASPWKWVLIFGGLAATVVLGIVLYVVLQDAATPEATPVATSRLIVASAPEGAQVLLDGAEVGTTPVELDELAPGVHRVEVSLPGHGSWDEEVNLQPGQVTPVLATLEVRGTDREVDESAADRRDGLLSIDTTPASEVFLGQRRLGQTPIERLPIGAGVLDLDFLADGQRHRARVHVGRREQDGETRTFLNLADLR